jgi:hypothetical protein
MGRTLKDVTAWLMLDWDREQRKRRNPIKIPIEWRMGAIIVPRALNAAGCEILDQQRTRCSHFLRLFAKREFVREAVKSLR